MRSRSIINKGVCGPDRSWRGGWKKTEQTTKIVGIKNIYQSVGNAVERIEASKRKTGEAVTVAMAMQFVDAKF